MMFQRILILVLLQISNKVKVSRLKSIKFLVKVISRLVILALICFGMNLVLKLMRDYLLLPINDSFFVFVLIITQVISLVACISAVYQGLYKARDNQILLAYPVKNNELFMSKLLTLLVFEIIRNAYFFFPLVIGYGSLVHQSPGFYIASIPFALLLPLMSICVAAIVSSAIVAINSLLSKRRYIIVAVFVAFIGVAFYFVATLVSKIPTPIRIVQLLNSFVTKITLFMDECAKYGAIYTWVSKLMLGKKVFLNLVMSLGFITAIVIFTYYISQPIYFRLMSKTFETTTTKHKHTVNLNQSKQKILLASLKKEVLIAIRTPEQLISNYGTLFLLPFYLFFINFIFSNMQRNTLGNTISLVANIFIVLMVITASNTASATCITTEGYEFVLLKTAPSKTSMIAWSKMIFNIIVMFILLLISFIIFQIGAPFIPTINIWGLFGFSLIASISHIMWNVQLDLKHPYLADYANSGSIDGNPNISQSLLSGLAISVVFAGIAGYVFFLNRAGELIIGWLAMFLVVMLFFAYKFIMFSLYVKAYFRDIEY